MQMLATETVLKQAEIIANELTMNGQGFYSMGLRHDFTGI
jgi:hypothetical protein